MIISIKKRNHQVFVRFMLLNGYVYKLFYVVNASLEVPSDDVNLVPDMLQVMML